MSDIQRALSHVRERIAEAALRAGRDPSGVTLVAVSKTFPAEAVLDALAAGQLDFGENRVEEALPKIDEVRRRMTDDGRRMTDEGAIRDQSKIGNPKSSIRWHLIGHLQSRKARDAAGQFSLIHSIDSVKLAETLDRRIASLPSPGPQDVLLECNVSGEAAKTGFNLAGWEHDPLLLDRFVAEVSHIAVLPHLRVRGLMTMAPVVEQPDQARPFFASLRALREVLVGRVFNLSQTLSSPPASLHLSMGMTDDFEAAITEGATLVRIGRAIFGARQK